MDMAAGLMDPHVILLLGGAKVMVNDKTCWTETHKALKRVTGCLFRGCLQSVTILKRMSPPGKAELMSRTQ